jgi:hypothetical protein
MIFRNIVRIFSYLYLLNDTEFPQVSVIILIGIDILTSHYHGKFIYLESEGFGDLCSQKANCLKVGKLDLLLYHIWS